MPSIHGLAGLVAGAKADLARGVKVQVAGAAEALAQLFVLAMARGAATPIKKIVVCLPQPRDMAPWSHFLESALPPGSPISGASLPFYASYGNDRFINPALSRRQRLYALSRLADPEAQAIIVTTLPALAQKTMTPAALAAATLALAQGDEHDQDELAAKLDDLGYVRGGMVEEEGMYALRGGILDVFSPSESEPVRLEFMGDTLASLRTFSLADQKSTQALKATRIAPAAEWQTPLGTRKQDAQRLFDELLAQHVVAQDRDGMLAAFQHAGRFAGIDMFAPLFRQESASGFDYLGNDTLLVFPASEAAALEKFADYDVDLTTHAQQDRDKQRPMLPVTEHFVALDAVKETLAAKHAVVEFGNPYATASTNLYRVEARLTVEGAPPPGLGAAELFDKWSDVLTRVLAQEGTVTILATQDEQIERVKNLLAHRDVAVIPVDDLLGRVVDGHGDGDAGKLEPGRVYVGRGDLGNHLWLDDARLVVIPEHALFGSRQKKPKAASRKLQSYLSSFMDLKVGDLVVHVQHGIGRYKGMTSLTVAGLASDFLVIEFAGADKIYMPVDRLNLLQKYSAGSDDGDKPSTHALDKLGGPAWEKRKSRVKGAVKDMAEQLLKLQARRAMAKGIAYQAPDDTYVKFEAGFPYEETDDQLRAIHDVEADLRQAKPMDRLVCGDVGFGKTEVALRAAMRTVLEGYQVLVLVPTTVLCYQHYRTFQARLERFGIRVAQVNRFVSAAETKAATEGLQNGKVDVLIGTHRLLSKDVQPKRLGLLVIDEEQRFGVGHKEKLKELRAGVHVLTLTATPIPRTLHMAMAGLRDISIIATPPPNRLAVKTYIARFDETLIKDAIEQEIRRGGQVFFVHNRVEDIEEIRTFLRGLIPGLDVRVGHGQMREGQLEQVIVDFLEQKYPVLLCTTIIESGIDMPHVNTLIVDRADRYGLAQLYQLRGRVGRSNVQAYSYLLTPPEDRLSEDGKKRLDVLAAHQELGAGFQIASHDLELRGAGNLLGGEQSGHAADVGLELYTDMLEKAIHELRGEPVKEAVDTEMKIPVSAFIPATYVPVESQRLHFYKSLFAADGEGDLAKLKQEVEDRFGVPPPEVALLFKVARLKQLLRQIGAHRLMAAKSHFEVRFGSLTESQIVGLQQAVKRQPARYRLTPDYRLMLNLEAPDAPNAKAQDAMVVGLIALVDPLVAPAATG